MNSKKIKKQHPDIYEEFKKSNDIVVSMPFVINRMGDFFNDYRGMSIKQKIPLRLYVGLKKKHNVDTNYRDILFLNHKNQVFENVNSESIGYLHDMLEYINDTYKIKDIEISILSEVPKNYGVGFNTIFCSLIDLAFSYYTGGITDLEINDAIQEKNINHIIYNTNIGNVIRNKSKIIKSIGRIGLNTIITSFFSGEYQFVGGRKEIDDKRVFYTYRIEDIIDKTINKLQLDFSLVYSNIPSCLEAFDYQYNDSNAWVEKGFTRLNSLIDVIQNNDKGNLCGTLSKSILSDHNIVNDTYNGLLNILSIEVLYKFLHLLEGHNLEVTQSEVLIALNKIRFTNLVTKDINKKMQNFTNEVLNKFNENSEDFSIHQNDAIITGGSIIITSKFDFMRDKILNLIQQSYFINYYNSFEDGLEKNGFIIEKSKSMADLLSQKSLYSKDYGCIYGDEKDIQEEMIKYDIVFDGCTGKIIIPNKGNTIKKLLSQQATVDLFCKLITLNTTTLSNKDMIPSSYSKSKSEFVAKIVKPFIGLCEDIYGKGCIKLIVTGVANNFSVTCETSLKLSFIY